MKANLALALVGAAMISLPAFAQTTAPANRPADTAPKATDHVVAKGALYEMKAGQWRATKLTGLDVYNTNNEKIGDINELIVDRDGKIAAVVIGVGGFLGMGEHLVAMPFDQIKWVDEPRSTTVSTRTPATTTTTTTTTGSGTSAPVTVERTDRAAGASDHPATVTTTTPPADRPATTTMARTETKRDAYRGYPDHAVVNMTKDQLKALPEVQYAR